jgi:hypothetical protein
MHIIGMSMDSALASLNFTLLKGGYLLPVSVCRKHTFILHILLSLEAMPCTCMMIFMAKE